MLNVKWHLGKWKITAKGARISAIISPIFRFQISNTSAVSLDLIRAIGRLFCSFEKDVLFCESIGKPFDVIRSAGYI